MFLSPLLQPVEYSLRICLSACHGVCVSQGRENRRRIVQPQSCLQLVNGVMVLGLAFIGPTKNAVRQPEVWVHFQRLPEIWDCLVEPPLCIEWQSRLHVDDERERIQLQR